MARPMTLGISRHFARYAVLAACLLIHGLVLAPPPAEAAGPRVRRPAQKMTAVPVDSTARVLATMDGVKYTLQDWNRDVPPEQRQQLRTEEDRRRVLEQIFEPRLLMSAAEKDLVGKDSLVALRLENARRQILINAYLEKVVRPLTRASEEELKAWYDNHPDDYRVKESATLRHMQVVTRKEAEELRARALKGEDFLELIKKFSTDTGSREDAGAIGTVTSDGYFRTLGKDPALADTIFKVPVGQITQPLQAGGAWHLFRVDAHDSSRVQPFEAVKDQVRMRLEREKTGMVYRDHLEMLRKKLGYAVMSATLADSTLFLPSPAELFRQAQTDPEPAKRIELYTELLQLFPTSPYAEQAQFMIGFVASEELNDFDRAQKEFQKLVDQYPKSELAKSAQWMLEHMRDPAPNFELPDSLKSPGTGKPKAVKSTPGRK